MWRRRSAHLVPDAYDILRNVEHIYFDQPDSELDRVLGKDSGWRKQKAALATADAPRLRRLFADIYKDQLKRLAGYEYFGEEVIRGPKGPLYRLIYAAKHPVGAKFWNESIKKEFGGVQRLF